MRTAPFAVLLTLTMSFVATATGANPLPPLARKHCGSFHAPGLLTTVRVRVTRGPVPCDTAWRVMKKLFNRGPGSDPENWNCIGPQTGYARCSKSRPRRVIVASF